MGRTDVDHGIAWPGPVNAWERRSPICRRIVRRARYFGGVARARNSGEANRSRLAAGVADFHARLSGGTLLIDGGVPRQGRQQPSDNIPTGVYPTKTVTSTRNDRQPTWARLCETLDAKALMDEPDYKAGMALEEIAMLSTPSSMRFSKARQQRGIYKLTRRGPLRADLCHRRDVRRSAGPASCHREKNRCRRPWHAASYAQPISLSRTPSEIVAPTPERGEHTDQVLAEFGFSKKDIAALRQANAI